MWLRFTVEKALQGEQAFGLAKSDALRLAQILMGEPFDGTRDFSSDYQDALAELFRQFAGAAALALKPRAGGEVSLQFAGYGLARLEATPAMGPAIEERGSRRNSCW